MIVGGGAGCKAILRMVEEDTLGRFRMRVVGVADTKLDAVGVRYARALGIPVITSDYRELLQLPKLDLVIELTGQNEVRDEIERTRPPHVRLIDHFAARLFWDLHEAEEKVIRQRVQLREQAEAEQQRIGQIFDSIPDEILVLDTNMMIQHANATFLRNNNHTLADVVGRPCYEVDQHIRGECQVALENCPCATVLAEEKPCSVVRKHFSQDGRSRYAAIVAAPMRDEDGELVGVVEMTRDITHRIMLEEERRVTEARLQQFMEMAPLATYVKNRQGMYIEANAATCELLGAERTQIIGRTDLEILPRDAAEVLRRGDRDVIASGAQLSFADEVCLRGNRVFLSTIKYPVLDAVGAVSAVVGLTQDVTAQMEAEAALTRTREHLQNILDNTAMMIVSTDLDALITSFNRGAEIALGYRAEEVVGRAVAELFRDPAEWQDLCRSLQGGKAVQDHETVLVCRSGDQIPVQLNLALLGDAAGAMTGMVGMARDISRRKALMNQIIQSERLAAVGRLAAGVAHEINNPLAVISEVTGYLEELMMDGDQELLMEELREGLPKIAAHVRRGRSITSRLLSFARKSQARVEVADVNTAFDEILPFLEKEARLAKVLIERQPCPDIPPVTIDEVQLEEVLINLITNAIQAMTGRGGTIWLSTEQQAGKVMITVRDDGPGIAPEVRDHLFDPFVSTKPLGQGTGLGLSICYAIVKRNDGEIRVHSEPGRGATFQVVLPAARATPAPGI